MPASSSKPLTRYWLVLNALLVAMALLALSVAYLPADVLPQLEVLPLLSLLWAGLLVWPAGVWAFRRRWLVSSLHLALAAMVLPDWHWGGATPPVDPPGIRVLTVNAAALEYRRNLQPAFRALLTQQRPDIVCIQEALLTELVQQPDSLQAWQQRTGLRHLAFLSFWPRDTNELGMAIVSRYPIVRQGLVWRGYPQHPNNDIHFADLAMEGDTVRVYNVHLRSYNLGGNGQGLLDSAEQQAMARQQAFGLRRVPRAWAVQRQQLDTLARHRSQWAGPVLVAGDWNNPPFGGMYARTRRLLPGLQDAWQVAGTGTGATTTVGGVGVRIDYLFASRDWEVLASRTIANPYSDHRMVLGILRMR